MALIRREDVWALVGDHVMTVRPGSKLEYVIHRYVNAIDSAPEVDAVPVVRCRDCKYWETDWKPNHSIDGEHFCPMISLVTSGEWFCAYGERRDGE